MKDAPTKSSRRSKPDFTIEYKFPKGFRLKRRKKINLIAAGKQTSDSLHNQNLNSFFEPTSEAKLSHKLSLSCNSLNGVESDSLRTSAVKMRRLAPIKSACSSLSLNRPQTQVISSEKRKEENKSTSKAKCSCCACKTMTTRKGDIEFFEVEEIANWGSGILVLTKLINTKNVIKMVNYRYLKHIWVNDQEKKQHLTVNTEFVDE